jgi:uncharacterized lipoprotein YajG
MKINDAVKLCAVAIFLVAVEFTSGCGSPSQAQSTAPSSSVLVVNSQSQSVPVTGTVSINGTPSARIISDCTA